MDDGGVSHSAGKPALALPGGESAVQVIHRAYSVLEDVKRKYPDRTVLLVTHGCFCRAARLTSWMWNQGPSSVLYEQLRPAGI